MNYWLARMGASNTKMQSYFGNLRSMEHAKEQFQLFLAEVKKSYRKLAFENHPDRGGDVRMLQELNAAWEHLQKVQLIQRPKPRPQPRPVWRTTVVYSTGGGVTYSTAGSSNGWTSI